MKKNILARAKRKLHFLTVEKIDDFIEMRSKNYGNIRLVSNHYRIRNRNYYGMKHEPDLLKFIDDLPCDIIMWDVGANVGYFSLYAAKKGIKVLAFEPDQITCGILNKNIYLNNLSKNVLSVPIALNDETKVSSFFMRNFKPANAYNTFDRELNERGESFEADFTQGAVGIIGDDLVLDKNLSFFSEPEFIKIDVDGNEFKVLSGIKNTLKKTKYLCIELGYSHPEFKKVLELLNEAGFNEIKDRKYIDEKRENEKMRNFYFQRR